jgi:SAM-dependent methyltransferase
MQPSAYDEMRALEDRHWWFRGKRIALTPLLRRALRGAPDGPIVDVGCGTGGNLVHLAQLHLQRPSIGVDPDARALEHCASRSIARLIRGQGDRLPLADGSAACVTALDILEHIPDDHAALREIARVLRPGGALVASVPAYPWLWSQHDEALGHVRRYRSGELQERVRASGLRIEHERGFNFLLLPAVALVRVGTRRKARDQRGPSTDFFSLPAPLNAALTGLFAIERAIASVAPIRFGVSLALVARKP